MFSVHSRYSLVTSLAIVSAAWLLGGVHPASAQVLYNETFDDAMLAEVAMANANVTIENGIARFSDPADGRATFSVVQPFTAEVMTFSFDVVESIVQTQDPVRMEVILRAGVGTAHGTLQNADHVVESIIFRGGNRGAYTNNGNESIFLVANNKATDLTFDSPIDGTSVTLMGFQYIPYVHNKTDDTWGQIKGISNYNGGARALERFGIGSSTTGDVGTFAIDNVLVVSGVSFDQVIGPPPVFGDVDGDGIGGEFPDDFEPIRANFRKSVSGRTAGDLVGNGIVDFADFDQWKTAFLTAGGSLAKVDFSFLASVPEPTSVGLLFTAIAALAVCTNRKRQMPK
jgi:hypothetical protein